ncbi:MAG: glutathione S-transferase N-terminal domain-containing protein, partial [Synechococcaceae cyanobacterium]|nr:glutathione S-transferase N-terminal domain-containing protein [Synechococcaceae cyanobacterium]
VTLYRDHHAWCPYCQKVWLWLEERRIPYRVHKVTMVCYGEKEAWYRRLVPSGMLPALAIDGVLITESDRILEALEASFGPLEHPLASPPVRALRLQERELFRAWCLWLCQPARSVDQERGFAEGFQREAERFEAALARSPGPFLLGEFSAADLVFVPFVERMAASLAYYKGLLVRQRHPGIGRWLAALEQRPAYLGTQGDFHTHAHDLPPQMGGCVSSGSEAQRQLAARIDGGPWPIQTSEAGDPETSQPEPPASRQLALTRTLRHRRVLLQRHPLGPEGFDAPLRAALTDLASGSPCPPPPGSAAALRHLRDRISVPRDMPLHAARQLRSALERTARLDPHDPSAQPAPLPVRDRRDQDPRPFLEAASPTGSSRPIPHG